MKLGVRNSSADPRLGAGTQMSEVPPAAFQSSLYLFQIQSEKYIFIKMHSIFNLEVRVMQRGGPRETDLKEGK